MTAFYGHKTDCRCGMCRPAHAAYMREYRAKKAAEKVAARAIEKAAAAGCKPVAPPKRPEALAKGELLRVQCWCESEDVYVSKTDLWNGITHPCGRPECETMAAKERAA